MDGKVHPAAGAASQATPGPGTRHGNNQKNNHSNSQPQRPSPFGGAHYSPIRVMPLGANEQLFEPKETYKRTNLFTKKHRREVEFKPKLVRYLNESIRGIQRKNVSPSELLDWKYTLQGIKRSVDSHIRHNAIFLNTNGKKHYAQLVKLIKYIKQLTQPKPGKRNKDGKRIFSKRPTRNTAVPIYKQQWQYFYKSGCWNGIEMRESTKEDIDQLQGKIEKALYSGNLKRAMTGMRRYKDLYRGLRETYRDSGNYLPQNIERVFVKVWRNIQQYDRVLAAQSFLEAPTDSSAESNQATPARKSRHASLHHRTSSPEDVRIEEVESALGAIVSQVEESGDSPIKQGTAAYIQQQHASALATVDEHLPSFSSLFHKLGHLSSIFEFGDISGRMNREEILAKLGSDAVVQETEYTNAAGNKLTLKKQTSSEGPLGQVSNDANGAPSLSGGGKPEGFSTEEIDHIHTVVVMLSEWLTIAPEGEKSDQIKQLLDTMLRMSFKVPELMNQFERVLYDEDSSLFSIMVDYEFLNPPSPSHHFGQSRRAARREAMDAYGVAGSSYGANSRRIAQRSAILDLRKIVQPDQGDIVQSWLDKMYDMVDQAKQKKDSVTLKFLIKDLFRLSDYPLDSQLKIYIESLRLDAGIALEELRNQRRMVWQRYSSTQQGNQTLYRYGDHLLKKTYTLGQGGFGKVVSVEESTPSPSQSDKKVKTALKTQDNNRRLGNGPKREFLMASILDRLKHVVKVYDLVVQEDSSSALRMEQLPGDIQKIAMKRASPYGAYLFILQLMKAVSDGHKEGVFWADIKPDNLRHDENSVLKMIDLGLTRFKWELMPGSWFGTLMFINKDVPFNRYHTEDLDSYAVAVSILMLIGGFQDHIMELDNYGDQFLGEGHKDILASLMETPGNKDFRPLLDIADKILNHGMRISDFDPEFDLKPAFEKYKQLKEAHEVL